MVLPCAIELGNHLGLPVREVGACDEPAVLVDDDDLRFDPRNGELHEADCGDRLSHRFATPVDVLHHCVDPSLPGAHGMVGDVGLELCLGDDRSMQSVVDRSDSEGERIVPREIEQSAED